jgi:hypothetical protein
MLTFIQSQNEWYRDDAIRAMGQAVEYRSHEAARGGRLTRPWGDTRSVGRLGWEHTCLPEE